MFDITDRLGVFSGKENTGKTLSNFPRNKEEKRERLSIVGGLRVSFKSPGASGGVAEHVRTRIKTELRRFGCGALHLCLGHSEHVSGRSRRGSLKSYEKYS